MSTTTSYDGNCAVSSEYGVDTQINSTCEASADASFDGTLLGSFGKIRKPCNLRKSGAPCDAIWIDSYKNRSEDTSVYNHTLYTDVTAFHALGTSTNEVNTAILRHRSGNANATIKTTLKWFESKKTYEDGEIVEDANTETRPNAHCGLLRPRRFNFNRFVCRIPSQRKWQTTRSIYSLSLA